MKRFSPTPPSATSLSHFRLTSFASILFGIGVAIACGSSDGGSDGDGKDGKDGNGSGGSGQDSSIDGNDGLSLDGGGEGNVNGVCGNGSLTQDEACDDGNTKAGDGCSADCLTVEPGFTCSVPGKACRPFARCGDGVVSKPEQCDDGDVDDGDGCSSTCKVEIGFKCSGTPSECDATTCGDFVIEGAETCDDGNALPYDGCNHLCQAEPLCGPSGCTSACGDGLVIDEACDDGNTTSGDGCSATCEIEENYTCETAPCERIGDQCVMRIPALFRDKNAGGDFQPSCSKDFAETGLVKTMLGTDGTPEITAGDHSGACINNFSTWYHGDTGIVIGSLILFDNGSGGFVNRWKDDGTKYSYNGTSYDGNPFFFPIDNAEGSITPTSSYSSANTSADYGGGSSAGPHNFHFTSQIQYWFQYDQDVPLVLNFTGDDDVWVFINRKLAVDVGGLHPPRSGNVTINSGNAASYNLQDGKVYPISVFHAERKTDGSSFRLTLSGFDTGRSECKPNCGDGVIGAGEECDDGKNDGGYNECQPGCVLGGYCGDGIKQESEDCDDNAPDAPPSCRGCRLLVVK